MPRHHALRAPLLTLLTLLPAIVIAGCAGDSATGPATRDYLVASRPQTQAVTLSNLVLTTTTMAIGANAANYAVTITNTKGKMSAVTLQGYIRQTRISDGQEVDQGAGGTTVSCSSKLGDLPPHSTCASGFSINTTGQTQFGPVPEPGPATFHLELTSGGNVLDFTDVSITLQ